MHMHARTHTHMHACTHTHTHLTAHGQRKAVCIRAAPAVAAQLPHFIDVRLQANLRLTA